MPALINPLPGHRLTDAFGYRDPVPGVPGSGGLHSGQDFAAPGGTPIRATASGRISFVGWKDQYGGNMVHIDHDDGTQTRYAHLSGFSCSLGQRVNAGEIVAFVGTTGASNGNHLHLEHLVNGRYVDPMLYISTNGPSTKDDDMLVTKDPGGNYLFTDDEGIENIALYFDKGVKGEEAISAMRAMGLVTDLTQRQADVVRSIARNRAAAKRAELVAAVKAAVGTPDTSAITKGILDAIAKQGVKVDAAALSKDIAKAVNDDAAKRMIS